MNGFGVSSVYSSREFGLQTFHVVAYRKSRLVTWHATSSFDKLPSQMIQGASEVMDGITDERSPAFRRLLSDSDTIKLLSGFRLFFADYSIGLAIQEDSYCAFEIIDVLLCPSDFFVDSSKTIWHGGH